MSKVGEKKYCQVGQRAYRETLETVIPGANGLECSVYAALANCTKHLRENLYVVLYVPALGRPYLPGADEVFETDAEHTPFKVFRDGQRAGKIYGRGIEPLEAVFYCYSPACESAVEGVVAVEEALKMTATVAHKPHLSRDAFSFKNFWQQARYLKARQIDGRLGPAYRPPQEQLREEGIER